MALESLLPFTASEKEFLDRLLDYCEIEPVLLTEDQGLAERTRYHSGPELTECLLFWMGVLCFNERTKKT